MSLYVTVHVTVYVTPTSQLSAAVQLWKEPNPQLLAKSHGMSKSSSELSQLISVEAKASEDEAKNKRKLEVRTTVVMLRKEIHEDYIHESKRKDVQKFD
jgi:hypothetical protein